MTQVVIQPSFGNPTAQRHWRDTLDQEIEYGASPHAEALTSADRAGLDTLHVSGAARFWGATGNHDKKMGKLQTGDVVLFTGKKLVRAVGEVGYSFRNPAFADTLWAPHPERGSYRNVYSLLSFQATVIPYEEIWDLPGFNSGDNFMGLRLLDAYKANIIIDGLNIETLTAARKAIKQEQKLIDSLVSQSQIVDVEAVNTENTCYEKATGTTLVRRVEAILVREYRAALDGASVTRIRVPSGVTDLYVVTHDDADVIEAKRSADHHFVRQALGQLLDYYLQIQQKVTRLTGLFPSRPANSDIELLHHYGIDCVHRDEDGTFKRLPAPSHRRDHMMQIREHL
ncbi:hypothetical protein NE236_25160 [Actinoallomurus purpureus]|uniref:hypothetical protein n=1 Tax=Actinoallomurus purpureus TaxID=478114 RepID=UPI0020923635|nr:hypothetical protein [Actinoallomurus purpureus]MCO6008271.1 hypothetical protein [Actinoallomurus purpureus]